MRYILFSLAIGFGIYWWIRNLQTFFSMRPEDQKQLRVLIIAGYLFTILMIGLSFGQFNKSMIATDKILADLSQAFTNL